MGAEGDGVIELDGAPVLEAEDGVGLELRGPGAIGHGGQGRRFGKPGVVAGTKPTEEAVGGFRGANLGEAELRDEAILHGAEEALDAALGLGARRGDPFNAQLVQDAADLRERALAAELLGDALGRARIAVEDPMAIGIGREREPAARGHLLEDV